MFPSWPDVFPYCFRVQYGGEVTIRWTLESLITASFLASPIINLWCVGRDWSRRSISDRALGFFASLGISLSRSAWVGFAGMGVSEMSSVILLLTSRPYY